MENENSPRSGDIRTAIDPERRLALGYAGWRDRASLAALWALDAALGTVVAAGAQPAITQIKLAWWRDALERLDRSRAPPEPLLTAIESDLLPRGISGASLAQLTQAWDFLLGEAPLSGGDLSSYAQFRGGLLFRYSALLLAPDPPPWTELAGEGWALAELARRSSREDDRHAALAAARERFESPKIWPTALRPLGMLAILARRDARRGTASIEAQGAPVRMLRMLVHRVSGR